MKIAKIVLPAVALTSALGFAGYASAGAPGPNGHNTFGLCTAYSAGSEKGQEMKHQAPPFAALEQAASDAGYDSVEAYCADNGTHPGKSGK
jgi:hypothetical protein